MMPRVKTSTELNLELLVKQTEQNTQRGMGGRPRPWAALAMLLSATAAGIAQTSAATPDSHTLLAANTRNAAGVGSPRVPQMSPRAREHYQLLWGVDELDVKAAESGQMIRFSYLVLDPQKAATLNDKAVHPFLVDEGARVKLEIPTMEKVGQLRQSSTPEAGKSYWMVFSNKGGVVKPGDRVTIVVGHFRADGLYVR